MGKPAQLLDRLHAPVALLWQRQQITLLKLSSKAREVRMLRLRTVGVPQQQVIVDRLANSLLTFRHGIPPLRQMG